MQAAEQGYRQILAANPNHADALHLLGVIAHQVGNHQAAIQCIGAAIRLKGTDPAFHANLAVALNALVKWDEAVACYRHALELKPDYAEAHCNLGVALKRLGKLSEAAACYRRALELKPNLADAHQNLGNLLQDQGQREEAIACYRRVLELKPRSAATYKDLGNALKGVGKYHEAESCCRRALELKPDLAGAHNNLGNALKCQGRLEEAIACYRRALELKPDYRKAHSNLLLALHYRSGITASDLAAAHVEFGRRHAPPLLANGRRFENDRDPARRLRIGFLAPDFGRHAVGFFLVRVWEHLDPDQGEVVGYSDRTLQDELTARLRASSRVWRDVAGWADERLADQILADRIDILFDLAGHTAGNRLAVFARKVAPLQVTWAGYVGTTGLPAMDYLLADRHQIPASDERHYCESVLRMPDGYICYDPPSYAEPVSPLPALSQGYVTYGSFNNPAKINPAVSELWARILQRVPQSRLVLKYRGMTDSSVRGILVAAFASHGIDPQRLEFLDFSPHADALAQYQRIDLALDPFPYSGGLTTCEALWMGVPVVTWPGETFASRHSLSHLSTVGLTETIADNADDYVESAVALSQDLPRLAAVRSRLRAQMAASPLVRRTTLCGESPVRLAGCLAGVVPASARLRKLAWTVGVR